MKNPSNRPTIARDQVKPSDSLEKRSSSSSAIKRQRPQMPGQLIWSIMPSGKHQGMTMPQTAFIDPDFLFFCTEKRIFGNWGRRFGIEGLMIVERLRNIKILRPKSSHARFIFNVDGEFIDMKIVPQEQSCNTDGSRIIYQSDRIDMSVLRQIKAQDYSAYTRLVGIVKTEIFGNRRCPTSADYEQFFSNVDNFHVSSFPFRFPTSESD